MPTSKTLLLLAIGATLVGCGGQADCPQGFLADSDGNCLQVDSASETPGETNTTTGGTTTATTTTTTHPLDEDFVNKGPGDGYYWEAEDRDYVLDECGVQTAHELTLQYLAEGFTLSNASVRDQTFQIIPSNLALGGTGSWAQYAVYANALNPSICSYELEGDFSCSPIVRDYDFVGFHDELNAFLPPGMPPFPDPNATLSYSVTASGAFSARNAAVGPAVAWDFGMRWATDLSLEMTIDCTGPECDFVLLNTEVSAFPCTTILEFGAASLDDPNIPS